MRQNIELYMYRTFIMLSLFSPTWALADSNYHYVCTLESDTRVIEVAYLVPEQKVPCEVRYQKENGETAILWRADNQEGFCETQTKNLIEKQKNWGFDCKSDNVPTKKTDLPFQNTSI